MKKNGPWGANEPSSTQAPAQAKVEPKKATQRQVESESSDDAYGSEDDDRPKKVKKEKKAPVAETKIDSLIDIGGGNNQA